MAHIILQSIVLQHIAIFLHSVIFQSYTLFFFSPFRCYRAGPARHASPPSSLMQVLATNTTRCSVVVVYFSAMQVSARRMQGSHQQKCAIFLATHAGTVQVLKFGTVNGRAHRSIARTFGLCKNSNRVRTCIVMAYSAAACTYELDRRRKILNRASTCYIQVEEHAYMCFRTAGTWGRKENIETFSFFSGLRSRLEMVAAATL